MDLLHNLCTDLIITDNAELPSDVGSATPGQSGLLSKRLEKIQDGGDQRVQPWRAILGDSVRTDIGNGLDHKVSYISMHDGKDGFANVGRAAVGLAG